MPAMCFFFSYHLSGPGCEVVYELTGSWHKVLWMAAAKQLNAGMPYFLHEESGYSYVYMNSAPSEKVTTHMVDIAMSQLVFSCIAITVSCLRGRHRHTPHPFTHVFLYLSPVAQ
jgi:hypothetical protein